MKPLQLSRPAMIMTPSDTIQSVALTTSAQALDVPTGGTIASFASDSNFYASFGSTGAAVPTTTTTAPSTGNSCSELNPTIRDLHSTAKTTGLSIIAPAAGGILTISWFSPGG